MSILHNKSVNRDSRGCGWRNKTKAARILLTVIKEKPHMTTATLVANSVNPSINLAALNVPASVVVPLTRHLRCKQAQPSN